MKTEPLDFVLSTLVLTLLMVLAFFMVALIGGYTAALSGAYHVVLDLLLLLLFFGLLCALFNRLLLHFRPFNPGTYSMDEALFTRWKLFTVVYEFGKGALLPFTTVFARPLIVKLFGANIGSDIALGGRLVDPELITIGNEAVIGQDSVLTAHAIISGAIILDEVRVGDRATVGVNVVVMPGVDIGAGSIVAAGAVVAPNTRIPAGELWAGIPARKIKDVDDSVIRG